MFKPFFRDPTAGDEKQNQSAPANRPGQHGQGVGKDFGLLLRHGLDAFLHAVANLIGRDDSSGCCASGGHGFPGHNDLRFAGRRDAAMGLGVSLGGGDRNRA